MRKIMSCISFSLILSDRPGSTHHGPITTDWPHHHQMSPRLGPAIERHDIDRCIATFQESAMISVYSLQTTWPSRSRECHDSDFRREHNCIVRKS
jgi:hypothetical protein